ncbi:MULTISPECIES: hypothetical protein [unclassified Variovorax]|uniref:hypothetical protein n=1 Tax=unclassified Variovorax TaxID=663243 RepID=UPI00076D8EAB|nr:MULTISPECIES: hypothetical protein [unclassified Variovorax]KWT98299.1 hypothetical protein APY03_0434 [Variovorax sp. WDL1]PNG50046.1 hypothetical protein CHC06_05627 [Variovorax sp. B2]PNG50918.1 hypothetical protein CHC07_05532 [Variovorax sp. B4]VTU41581.1 hypothetical protein SRS16P1_00040 [Variovorax sp. SRS16]VTU41611.1 hypothetical protein E5P1_00040 [Variovorax sp. PBL-E5]
MKKLHLAVAALLATASGVALAQSAPNPFARPVEPAQPAPVVEQSQPGMPLATPGVVQAPVPAAPAMPIVLSKPTIEEEVDASRVGTVNGLRIYRGTNTYVFEKAADKELIRRVSNPAAQVGAPAATVGAPVPMPAAPTPRDLPSSVGKPAPKK